MRKIKFVPPAAVEDHLQVGWRPLYPLRFKAREKPAWLVWPGDGYPRHPEAEKLMYGCVPKSTGHPGEEGGD